jgi:hypothetical protein
MKTILFLDVNGVLDCLRCGHGADCGHRVERHVLEEVHLVILDDGDDADPRPHMTTPAHCHFSQTSLTSGLDNEIAAAVIALAPACAPGYG